MNSFRTAIASPILFPPPAITSMTLSAAGGLVGITKMLISSTGGVTARAIASFCIFVYLIPNLMSCIMTSDLPYRKGDEDTARVVLENSV